MADIHGLVSSLVRFDKKKNQKWKHTFLGEESLLCCTHLQIRLAVVDEVDKTSMTRNSTVTCTLASNNFYQNK